MEYRRLGNSGLKVSAVCLGAMMFGDRTSKPVASRIVASATEAGVNFIDTADSYAKGGSERMVGELIRKDRERWVLATKVRSKAMGTGPNAGGLGRKWMMYEIDQSLARLKSDYIDIYYLHQDDLNTPLAETVSTMGDLIRAGKVRYFGISNFQGWRIAEIVHTCRSLGVARPIALQPNYNAMNREPEVEMFPACVYYGIGIVTHSPLARGVLTGKYLPGVDPAKNTRAGQQNRRTLINEFRVESLKLAQRIKAHAEKRAISAGQFAFNWVLNNKLVTSVIAGPRTLEQWREYLDALAYRFDQGDEAFLNSLVPPGHPSTPGHIDPKFPVRGRVPRN